MKMSWPFRRQKNTQSYEKKLSKLAVKINQRQQNLVNANIRLRRLKGAITLYCGAIYTVYSAIVIFGIRKRSWIQIVALFLGPFGIWFLRWLIQSWYNWVRHSQEEHLKSLEIQHKELIEELKQKTNFYSTQALLDRYDAGGPSSSGSLASTPVKQHSSKDKVDDNDIAGSPRNLFIDKKEQLEQTHDTFGPVSNNNDENNNTNDQSHMQNHMQNHMQKGESLIDRQNDSPTQLPSISSGMSVSSSSSFIPYTPKWYDRILDLLVGEDEQSAKNRQALICANCHTHNGLAQYGELAQNVVYICPRCGFRNGQLKQEPVLDAKSEDKNDTFDKSDEKTTDGTKSDEHQ